MNSYPYKLSLESTHVATLDNNDKFVRANIYLEKKWSDYIVKCFKDGALIDTQVFDDSESAIQFAVEFID